MFKILPEQVSKQQAAFHQGLCSKCLAWVPGLTSRSDKLYITQSMSWNKPFPKLCCFLVIAFITATEKSKLEEIQKAQETKTK